MATVKAHSGTQTGDSFLLGKLGTTPMITSKYAGSKTKSFPRKSTYIACIVASQTVLVLQACKLQFTGTKAAGGATVTTMCQYSGTLAKPAMVLCTFPDTFQGLGSVNIQTPAGACLLQRPSLSLMTLQVSRSPYRVCRFGTRRLEGHRPSEGVWTVYTTYCT